MGVFFLRGFEGWCGANYLHMREIEGEYDGGGGKCVRGS